MELKKLCEPVRIGGMELKNRMVMAAMAMRQAVDGFVSEHDRLHYEERAKGGVGLIIVGGCSVDYQRGRLFDGQHAMDDDRFIPGMSGLVGMIHGYGAKAALQLFHGGNVVPSNVTHVQPVSASAVARTSHELPRALTQDEIAELIDRFAKGAERAKKAGFDAVELSACHRYIIQNFLSAAWNRRQDEYGGDLKNRARFLLEIIGAIKTTVGNGYPLLVRLNGQEYGVEGGTTLEEAKEAALLIQEAGVDAVHITAFPATYPYPRSTVPPTLPIFRPGCYVHLAEGVKRVVRIPVIAVGRISPEMGERILREEKADLIAFGRGLIADPELPNKITTRRTDEIRRCLGCNECYGFNQADRVNKRCTVNASAFTSETLVRTDKRRRVFVVGGGPAGMEAARVAALRGHEVTLFDRNRKLGEQLQLASMLREEYDTLNQYLITQMGKLGVQVELGRTVNLEILEGMKPDAVILATGARSAKPEIPGIEGRKIVCADNLRRRKILWNLGSVLMEKPLGRSMIRWLLNFGIVFGKRVVVMGGGLAGGEIASFLAEKGKHVTVVTEQESMENGIGTMPVLKQYFLDRLTFKGIPMLTGVRFNQVTDRGLVITTREGETQTLEADTIICVAGVRASAELFSEVKGNFPEVHIAGDSAEPRGILEAISDGHRAGREV